MKKTDTSRRRFLAGAATAATGALLTAGFTHRFALAATKDAAARRSVLEKYTPRFFNDMEWQFILRACDCLIPTDEVGPGALDALVPIFIDQQMETSYGHGGLWYMQPPFITGAGAEFGYQYRYTPRDIYRIGIADVNSHCMLNGGKAFAATDPAQSVTILQQLEGGKIELTNIPAKVFFGQLLANTREGFLSDPRYGGNEGMVGWKMIGFPGARGDYLPFVTQYNKPYPNTPVSIEGQEG